MEEEEDLGGTKVNIELVCGLVWCECDRWDRDCGRDCTAFAMT